MVRSKRSILLRVQRSRWYPIVLATISSILLIIIVYGSSNAYKRPISTQHSSEECFCKDEDGSRHNFCYRLPQNKSIRGKPFSCNHLPTVKSLGLLDTSHIAFAPGSIDPMFVAAFSENHEGEAVYLMGSIAKYFPKIERMIVYELGKINRTLFKKHSFMEFRKFDFTRYPEYVASLKEYRWKPLMIAEALIEFKAIWYMDTSILFKKGNLNHVHQLITCRNYVTERPPMKSVAERDLREERTPIENGWNVKQWTEAVAECRKPAFLMNGFTGHGIYVATAPDVYKFIPTNYTEIKKHKAKMYESGLILVVKTKDTIEDILKWHVLCALEEDCMAGNRNEDLTCFFGEDLYAEPPNCHRYDQSVLNVLVANSHWYDKHYYASEIVDFFDVHRRYDLYDGV